MKISTDKTNRALTLIEVLMILAVLMLLAAFFLSSGRHSFQTHAATINCLNNLKQVGLAYRIYAGDNGDKFPMQISATNGGTMESALLGDVAPTFQIMSNELSTSRILLCPQDSRLHSATNFTSDFNNSRVSYFVGLEADQNCPNMFLSGDRNITNGASIRSGLVEFTTNQFIGWTSGIHVKLGNIGLADGSVQQVSTSGLQDLLKQTGVATNRLAMP